MSLPELSGITSHLGRGDIGSWSRDPRVRRNPASAAEGAPCGAPGRGGGSQSWLSIPTRGHSGKDRNLPPPPRSGLWDVGLLSGGASGCLPSPTPPQGSLLPLVDPSPAILCPGNLVICLPLVPQEGMRLGGTRGPGSGFPPWCLPGGARIWAHPLPHLFPRWPLRVTGREGVKE